MPCRLQRFLEVGKVVTPVCVLAQAITVTLGLLLDCGDGHGDVRPGARTQYLDGKLHPLLGRQLHRRRPFLSSRILALDLPAMMAPTFSVAARSGSENKCAYLCVVCGCVWPSKPPM